MSATARKRASASSEVAADELQRPRPKRSKQKPGAKPGLRPFWNSRRAESSKTLWLPAATGSRITAPNSCGGRYTPVGSQSWYNAARWEHRAPSRELFWTASPLTSGFDIDRAADDLDAVTVAAAEKAASLAEEATGDDTKATAARKAKWAATFAARKAAKAREGQPFARKVRLRPNTEDAQVLCRWIGCYRAMYNRAVEWCNANRQYDYGVVCKAVSTDARVPAAAAALPAGIRQLAVRDATLAFASNFAKRRANPGHVFEVGFKTKKTAPKVLKLKAQNVSVSGDAATGPRLHLGDKRGNRQLSSEGIPFDPRYLELVRSTRDPALHLDGQGRFWLTAISARRPDTQGAAKDGAVALDPGVRTFQTTYSPDGTSYKLGDEAASRVMRLLARRDECLAAAATRGESRVKRRRHRRKAAALMDRVTGLVDEMHWKIANFLVARWQTIYVPDFRVQQMARREGRAIGKDTVRRMMHLRHYTFRQRLKHVAAARGVQVVEVTEEYTSKTCGACGELHGGLGGAKEFACPSCGARMDRDGNGARNIFLKSAFR